MEDHPIAVSIVGVLIGASIAINAGSLFPDAQVELFDLEGGFVDHVDDLGGATNWGITEALARSYGYVGPMADLPVDSALVIAYSEFWTPLQLDEIATVDDPEYMSVAFQIYKLGFHAGRGRAVATFQRCLNVLNQSERLYDDIQVDGGMGRRSLRAFRAYRNAFGAEGVEPMSVCIDGLTVAFYVRISEARPQNESFTRGWFNRLID